MAKPFIKWVGGKTQLLKQIEGYLPERYNTYFEPFIGGGALYFYLQAKKPDKAVINDLNPQLANLYIHLRNQPHQLIAELKQIEKQYLPLSHNDRKDFYYEIRKKYNALTDSNTERSALLIFLNKTGFNGMYRENPRGEFNIPFGRNNLKSLFDQKALLESSRTLQNTTILNGTYETAVENAQKGDFIYFDPPYIPLSKTASFTKYTSDGFGPEDQVKLRDLFVELHARGCFVMLSNSNAPEVQELYQDFKRHEVLANRAVNCKATGRGKIKELIIINY